MARIVSEKKAPELVEHVMRPFLAGLHAYFGVHLSIHKAHVAMLGERGLVAPAEAAEILGALQKLGDAGLEGMDLHPDTDLYMQMEAFVRTHAPKAGGKMHMGRSRNDLYACAARMMTRDKLAVLITSVQSLQQALLARSREHATTVMPGYTHLQHAEPVTLGHFLLAFHDALARDVKRLSQAYEVANLNALGAAALAGSSLALDRSRTADLMGFDGLVENTYDAVAGRDYILQAASAVTVLASTIARVVDTLIVWSTSEFGMVEMPDSYAYTSSIMPQKRNPGYFFESVRSKVARAEGDLAGAFATLKGTTFIQSRETSFEVTVPVFRGLEEVRGAVEVMRGVTTAMIPRAERMEQNCASEFSGTTEIANFLVKDKGLDFRSAYQVVASVVRIAHERKLRPAEVNAALVDEIAQAELGRAVGLSDAQVRHALDPAGNVELKVTVGGPSKAEMLRMLDARDAALHASVEEHGSRVRKLQEAHARLEAAVAKGAARA